MGVQNYYWHNEKITTKTDIEHYGLRNCYFSSISYPNFHDSSVNYDFGYHEYQATMPWQIAHGIHSHYFIDDDEFLFIPAGYLPRNINGSVAADGIFTKSTGYGTFLCSDWNESGGSSSDVSIEIHRYSDNIRIGSNYFYPTDFGSDFAEVPYTLVIVLCAGGGGGSSGKYVRSQVWNGGGSGGNVSAKGADGGRGEVFIFY